MYTIMYCNIGNPSLVYNPSVQRRLCPISPGLVDFAIRLVIFVLILPNGQVLFLGKFKLQKDCNQSC